jgi:predicted alpha/beta hydrolase family esterase
MFRFVTLPGIGGSSEDHWQSHGERMDNRFGATCAIHAAMLTAERAWRASLAAITRRIGRSLSAEVRAKAAARLGANVRT